MKRSASKPPTYAQATKKRTRTKSAGRNANSVSLGGVAKMLANNRPEYIKTTLRYVDFDKIDPSAVSVAGHVYRANTVFDCDATTGTTPVKPPGFKEYIALYQRFTVTKARIKVSFTTANAGEWTGAILGVSLNTQGTVAGSAEQYIGNGDCNWALIGRDSSTRTVTMEVDMRKYFAKDIWTEEQFSGSELGDAARQCYFHVFAQGDEDMGFVFYCAEIEYDIAFRTIKEVPFTT